VLLLDEAHAAHVGGEIVHVAGAIDGSVSGLAQGEVELVVLGRAEVLVPGANGLDVHGPHAPVPRLEQSPDEVPADESAGAGHDNQIVLLHVAFLA
jgi:hypothetical protein